MRSIGNRITKMKIPKTIQVEVYYYIDEDGVVHFDTEEIRKEFEFQLEILEYDFKSETLEPQEDANI